MATASRNASAGAAAGTGAPFELTSLVGFVVYRLSATLGSLGERDAQEVAGLSLPEYRCMATLATKGSMGVIALCQAMMIDKAWVSRTLSRLQDKGLVASASDREDARRTVYGTTPKGRRLARRLIQRALQRQRAVLEGLSEAERRQLAALLARMQHNADRMKDAAVATTL